MIFMLEPALGATWTNWGKHGGHPHHNMPYLSEEGAASASTAWDAADKPANTTATTTIGFRVPERGFRVLRTRSPGGAQLDEGGFADDALVAADQRGQPFRERVDEPAAAMFGPSLGRPL